jgi:hypothetical protein
MPGRAAPRSSTARNLAGALVQGSAIRALARFTPIVRDISAALVQVYGRAPEWLRPGDLIDGWRIEEIKQDQVQLIKGNQEQVLLLRADLAVEPRRRPAPARPGQQQSDDPAITYNTRADEVETQG